jgi:hypothetical protein
MFFCSSLFSTIFSLKKHLQDSLRSSQTNICGLIDSIALDIFFHAIHVSNVSITHCLFFVRDFFASEPLFYGRKVLWYEVFFGL